MLRQTIDSIATNLAVAVENNQAHPRYTDLQVILRRVLFTVARFRKEAMSEADVDGILSHLEQDMYEVERIISTERMQ